MDNQILDTDSHPRHTSPKEESADINLSGLRLAEEDISGSRGSECPSPEKDGELHIGTAMEDIQMSIPEGDNAIPRRVRLGEEVIMSGLSASHFTDSPARVVVGFDGVKACPVILLPFELSTKIQKMIEYQRFVAKEQREYRSQLKAIADLNLKIRPEISIHQINISKRKQRIEDGTAIDVGEERQAVYRLEQELKYLGLLEKDLKLRREITESHLTGREKFLMQDSAEISEYLEEAFVTAKAIGEATEKADVHAPTLDLQEEYQEQVRSTQELYGERQTYIPLETGSDFMNSEDPVPTPEQQARMDARMSLETTRKRLERARTHFEQRDDEREREREHNCEAKEKGRPLTDDSEEAFDVRWVVRYRELTRKLLDAEEAYTSAKVAANLAGLPLADENQSSCFPEGDCDATHGYASSGSIAEGEDGDQQTFASSPRITTWLARLVDRMAPDTAAMTGVDVDDWGSGEEVRVEDSGSCVAEGSARRRIDKWRQIRPKRRTSI